MCSQRHRSKRPHSRAAWLRAGGGWVGSYTHSVPHREGPQTARRLLSSWSRAGAAGQS